MSTINSMKQARQAVQWKDLRTLAWWQVLLNVLLPYPFLALAWWSAWQGYVILALLGWFLFFTASFRQAHDGFHRSLGLGKRATDWLLCLSSGLLITSNHAIRQTHLQHHRAPLDESDVEASFYKLKWWQAIAGGTSFWLSLQWHGLALANERSGARRERHKIYADFACVAVMLVLALVLCFSFDITVLLYHVLVMVVANSFVGFVAGWCVHHGCGNGDDEIIARTERNWLVNLLTFNLLFHMEHHLFPTVPTNHLPQLAKRLDKIAPEMTRLRVMPNSSDLSNMFGVPNDVANIENGQKKLMVSKKIIADMNGKFVEGLG